MSDRDKQIDDMLDREAIRELPVRYCHCVRTRDVAGVLDLFADDAVFDVGAGASANVVSSGARTGKKALEESFRGGFEKIDPWPFVHNHVVNLTGPNQASGFVYAEIRVAGENMRTAMIVVYEDTYVKENGRWRFKVRRLNGTPIPA